MRFGVLPFRMRPSFADVHTTFVRRTSINQKSYKTE